MKKLITLILSALMFTGCTGAGNSPNSTYRQISMEEAVAMARREAKEGEIVSLSPASASFDMYKDFEARGRHFKDIVNSL